MTRFFRKIIPSGFTLLETLIVVSVVVLLISLSLVDWRYFQDRSELKNSVNEVLSLLKLAQSRTLAFEQSSQWGVYFDDSLDPHRYILFKGVSYSGRDQAFDEIHNLPKRIKFSQLGLEGGGKEVVFERLDGTTKNFGTISLWLATNHSQTETVYIQSSGTIALSFVSSPSDSQRVKDARHIHLNYSRFIDVATEKILLTFDNNGSPVTQEIIIADNLKDNQIFWEGEVIVGGSLQKLKIHTHRLNSSDTQFCFHRDADDNSKALKIDLSGDSASSPNLGSYNPSGAIFVKGNSIFVSSPLAQ